MPSTGDTRARDLRRTTERDVRRRWEQRHAAGGETHGGEETDGEEADGEEEDQEESETQSRREKPQGLGQEVRGITQGATVERPGKGWTMMRARLLVGLLAAGLLAVCAPSAWAGFGFPAEGGMSVSIQNADGTPDTQAGSHPFPIAPAWLSTPKNAKAARFPPKAR